MNSRKLKIGITGGIGSGKSTLSEYLRKKKFNVIDADSIAKKILVDDNNVKEKIIKSFGENSYRDNKLNTKYLAEKVFNDTQKVKKLNAIVHPAVIKKIEILTDESLEDNNIVFVEAALIFEAGMEEMFDYIITVSAEENTRIARTENRDKVSNEDIKDRMKNQYDEKYKVENSDFVINNDGDKEELFKKADFILILLKNLTEEN